MPQRINLAKKPVINSEAYWNPSGEEREIPSNHSKIPTAIKVITPETRCKIDAIAVTGNSIVCKSRLTGLCFFTILPTQLFIIFHPPDLGRKSYSVSGFKAQLKSNINPSCLKKVAHWLRWVLLHQGNPETSPQYKTFT